MAERSMNPLEEWYKNETLTFQGNFVDINKEIK